MLTDYLRAAMARAKYESLSDDGSFYGEIPELAGVWANANTLEACREELQEVLEGWILLRVSKGLSVPSVGRSSLLSGIHRSDLSASPGPDQSPTFESSRSLRANTSSDVRPYRGGVATPSIAR